MATEAHAHEHAGHTHDVTPAPAEPRASVLLGPLVAAVVIAGAVLIALGVSLANDLQWQPIVVLALLAFCAERLC